MSYYYLHKTIPKVDPISEIRTSNVTIQWGWIELSQNKYPVYAAVYAVAHWDVNKPIASSNWNLL